MIKFASQALIIFVTLSSIANAQEQIWKAVSGHEIKAEFVEIKDNCVVLKTQEGVVSPQLTALTEESRQLATKLNAAAAKLKNAADRARLAALTPAIIASKILTENYARPGQNLVGVYNSDAFDVYFYEPSSVAYIFIKENNQYLSEPLRLQLIVFYIDKANVKKAYTPRPALSLLEKPKFEKGVFTIRWNHKDDVESDLYIAVVNGEILAGYKLIDPPGISIKSEHYLSVYSPPAFVVEESKVGTEHIYFNPRVPATGVSRNELLEIMTGWTLELKLSDKPKGAQTSFPYTKAPKQFPGGNAKSYELSGGVYGPHSVSISPTGSGGRLYPSIYPGRALTEGFSLHFRKENPVTPASHPSSMVKIMIQ